MAEGSFEAKLTAKRETAAGIYLTVQVQPDDYRAELATLRVGSVLMLGWAEIVDSTAEEIPALPSKLSPEAVEAKMPKDRRPFDSLPLSQQCAIRCNDKSFREYLENIYGLTGDGSLEDAAANSIRFLCGIASRSALDSEANVHARSEWMKLEANYQSWLTDARYAEARR